MGTVSDYVRKGRQSLRQAPHVVVMSAVALVACVAVAVADDISNNEDATVDAGLEVMSLTAGGSTDTTTLRVIPTGTGPTPADGKSGCNLTGLTTLTVSVASSNPAVATATLDDGNPLTTNDATFTSCDDTKTVTVTPLTAGSTNITVAQVANTTGGTFNFAPAAFTVNVTGAPANVAPTVEVTGDDTANEGDTKTYDYTVTDPDDTPTVTTSCGDDGTKSNEDSDSFDCTFPDGPNSSTVSVSADDGDASDSDEIDVTIANVAPTVVLTGADSVDEGDTESYSYTLNDPGDDPNPVVTEDCGDDGTLSNSASQSFDCTFPDGPNSSTVSVSANDGDPLDNIGSDSIDVTIANVAPTVVLTGADSVDEGDTESYSYTLNDPGDDPNPVVTEDCGDDGTLSNSASQSFDCTFPDGPNSSTVSVSANDGDPLNNIGSDSIDVTIANLAPDVGDLSIGGATGTACIAGNSITLDFGFTDAGVNDADWGVNIDWGDGSTDADYDATAQGDQTQQSHTYGPGSHQITVTVTDKDGDFGASDAGQGSVSLLYNMTGILAPFNADGSSVWKYGSTLPVKVKITDCNGTAVSGLKPQVGTSMSSTTTPAEGISETASTSAADTTGVMRYSDGQYIYNFASKYLADGNATYYMYVRGKDAGGAIVTNLGQVSKKFGLKTK